MKSTKPIKSFLSAMLVVVLCLALSIGANAISAMSHVVDIVSGHALALSQVDTRFDSVSTNNTTSLSSNVSMRATPFSAPKKVKLGTVIAVPSGATLVSPSGSEFTGDTKATEKGFYTLKVNNYSYNIQAYTKYEPLIEVEFGGADLPAVVAQGETITLPSAEAVYYDENGDRVVITDNNNNPATVNVAVVSDVNIPVQGGSFVTPNANTTIFVRYSYKSDEYSYIYRDFNIKVQKDFSNDNTPTLTVSTPSQNANVNTKVDLPTASATDKYDSNLKFEVKVTKDGAPVQTVSVNPETGYAQEDPNFIPEDVIFDNGRNMSFYPTEQGRYTVTYKATNSQGKETRTHVFSIDVVDQSAPVFKSIADYKIPSKWGKTVYKLDQDAGNTSNNKEGVDSTIYFPTPSDIEIYDNLSYTASRDSKPDNEIVVSMTVVNPQGDTILRYTNLFGNPDQVNNAESDKYGNKDAKLADGFDPNSYASAIDSDGTKTFEGDYTVTYRAVDSKNQVATKTYKMTLVSNFEDAEPPIIDDSNIKALPKYIIANDNLDLTLPIPLVSDNASARLNTLYTIEDSKAKYDVKGGERLVYIGDAATPADNGIYLTKFNKDKDTIKYGTKLELGYTSDKAELKLSLSTVDGVGNHAEASSQHDKLTVEHKIQVVAESWSSGTLVINNDVALTAPSGTNVVTIPDNTITFGAGDGELVGFEVVVKQLSKNGVDLIQPVDVKNVELTTRLNNSTIDLKNMSFKASSSGEYVVAIRAFDVGGNNVVASGTVTVVDNGDNGWGESRDARAITELPTSIELGTAYKLPTYQKGNATGSEFFERTITGGAFELAGSMFTPKSATTYVFEDIGYDNDQDNDGTLLSGDKYYSTVDDSDVPTVTFTGTREAQRYLPLKDSNGASINYVGYILPDVVAYNKNGNAVLDTPTVKYNGTDDITVTKMDLNNNQTGYFESGGVGAGTISGWGFVPTSNGKYTVTYIAKIGSVQGTLSYTVYVGNITAPAFSLERTTVSFATTGDSFDFEAIKTDSSESDDTINGYTYTKTLADPSGSQVAQVTGKGTTYRDKINNGSSYTLDKSGDYTVKYEVEDAYGNVSTIYDTITVSVASNKGVISLATISTILIILGLVLILGAFVYLVRFRKIRLPSEVYTGKTTAKKTVVEDSKTNDTAKDTVAVKSTVVETETVASSVVSPVEVLPADVVETVYNTDASQVVSNEARAEAAQSADVVDTAYSNNDTDNNTDDNSSNTDDSNQQ